MRSAATLSIRQNILINFTYRLSRVRVSNNVVVVVEVAVCELANSASTSYK